MWMMAIFALLGGIAATWLSPHVIVWYWNPPAEMGFNCTKPIEWSLRRLQWAQLGGVVVGGLVGLTLYFAFRRRRPEVPPAA
jgi:hypothetical protein